MTEHLTDRSVLLSLQELTEDLNATQEYRPTDPDEAHALLHTLIRLGGAEALPSNNNWEAAARRVLTHLETDPDTAARAAAVLADPPADEQLGVETAAGGLIVLAAVIGWLQTKIDIRVRRHDNEWEFDFQLHKQPAPTSLLRQLAGTITRMISGPSEPSN